VPGVPAGQLCPIATTAGLRHRLASRV